MANRKSEYNQIVCVLQELHKKYPSYNMGRHLSTSLDEYKDIWGLSDKELLFALEKYAAEQEIDRMSDDSEFLKRVIEEGEHMFDIVDDTDDDQEEDF